jgi:hypothetical protein
MKRKIAARINKVEREINELMEVSHIDENNDLYSADGELLFSPSLPYFTERMSYEALKEARRQHIETRPASADISLENYV